MSRPASGRGLGPDLAAVAMDDALRDGEADAVAVEILGAMQALEHAEQLAGKGHVEAGAVVGDDIEVRPSSIAAADLDARAFCLCSELHRVADQLGEQPRRQRRVRLAGRQRADGEADVAALRGRRRRPSIEAANDGARSDPAFVQGLAQQARKAEQIVHQRAHAARCCAARCRAAAPPRVRACRRNPRSARGKIRRWRAAARADRAPPCRRRIRARRWRRASRVIARSSRAWCVGEHRAAPRGRGSGWPDTARRTKRAAAIDGADSHHAPDQSPAPGRCWPRVPTGRRVFAARGYPGRAPRAAILPSPESPRSAGF